MAKPPLLVSLTNPVYLSLSSGQASFLPPQPLPSSPGVYIFADAAQTPLYIGKSINLKSRIKQHYENGRLSDSKAAHFISQSRYLILQTVESDLAAIILEANLIKNYLPYYNAASKDDKTVGYIVIGDQPKYDFQVLHRSNLNLQHYENPATQIFGPYPNSTLAKILLSQIRHIFGYCQNPDNVSKRACFYFHLKLCPGPCNGTITNEDYKKHIKNIKTFLSGQFKQLSTDLKREITAASKKQQFETAQKKKSTLEALEIAVSSRRFSRLLSLPSASPAVLEKIPLLLKHPHLQQPPHRIECYDMATLNQENTVGAMVVFYDGQPVKDQYRKFLVKTARLGDPQTMKHIMSRRLRHTDWDKPDLIILDGGIPQLSIVGKIIPAEIPVIALSKKRETIHFYDSTGRVVNLSLPLHSNVLKLFQYIRDEAHRFATTYHKKRRQMTALAKETNLLHPKV